MKRKRLAKRLNTAYCTGKLKRVRPYAPIHPLLLALKALQAHAEATIVMFKGFNEANQRSPEEGNRYFEYLEQSGVLQMHSDTSKMFVQSLEQFSNKLGK